MRIVLNPVKKNVFNNLIQDAIDRCSQNGGGSICLNPGIYYSKPLTLISNLDLEIPSGVKIIFSNNYKDYSPVYTRWEGTECYAIQSLVFGYNCQNIKIHGAGIIDGNGSLWWNSYKEIRRGIFTTDTLGVINTLKPLNKGLQAGSGGGGIDTNFLRPSLIQLKNCKDIVINGITLQNSPFWNTHILYSEKINIDGVTFINPENAPNTDGLDIDSSSFINIKNCTFNVGDDCLCLKSGMDENGYRVGKSTNNINIDNCTMNKGHGGVVIGSETSGGINNIFINNCKMLGTDRGIRIKTRRQRCGVIDNVAINNIYMENVISPFVINMYYRCGAKDEDIEYLSSEKSEKFIINSTPSISNITVDTLKAYGVKSSSLFFLGLPESKIKYIKLKNIEIFKHQQEIVDEPAMDLFFTKVAQGEFFIKNIEGVEFSDIYFEKMEVNLQND
ncbi:MAG: glycoside hydrolase family 28 protein [Spirochaetales bacterium]|nr:glycoside hydrolase family 28 protein [Spirochaetales bacterium]